MGSPSYSPKDCTARYTHRSDHGATTTKNRGAPRLGVSPRFTGEKRVNLPDSHGLQTHTYTCTHTHTHIHTHTHARTHTHTHTRDATFPEISGFPEISKKREAFFFIYFFITI